MTYTQIRDFLTKEKMAICTEIELLVTQDNFSNDQIDRLHELWARRDQANKTLFDFNTFYRTLKNNDDDYADDF